MPLSKHEISEYYSDPEVRSALLRQIKDKPVLTFISLPSGETVARRHERQGKPITIRQAKGEPDKRSDLAYYTDRRYSEFHPVIGKRTNQLWVDIDPGPTKSLEELKPIVSRVASTVKKMPEVKNVQVAYSGGRGFYVRGKLDKERLTNSVRRAVNRRLKKVFKEPSIVFSPPERNQVRLDTSTLHDKGSIRALYSINADTGRVSLPLTRRELEEFDPNSASVRRLLGQGRGIPGIPKSKRTHALPDKAKIKKWVMSVQEHDAKRAGKHWDMRLVDPHTGFAHSWAVPKAQFPDKRPLLAIQTPTHTSDYALNFGKGEKQTIGDGYGAGTVEIKHQEPVNVVQSGLDKIKFERQVNGKPELLTLFRTKDTSWLMKKGYVMNPPYLRGRAAALEKLGMSSTIMTNPAPSETQQPLEIGDDETPAGELAKLLSDMESPETVPVSSRDDETTDSKLNRETSWDSPRDIPHHFMTGATTPMTGQF